MCRTELIADSIDHLSAAVLALAMTVETHSRKRVSSQPTPRDVVEGRYDEAKEVTVR